MPHHEMELTLHGTRESGHMPAPSSSWLDLSPEQLRALHRQMVRDSAAQLDAIGEVAEALAACRRYPDAETAGDACRLALLLSPRSFVA